jgi:hypothetical protein
MSNTYKIHYQNKKIQVCLTPTKYTIKIKNTGMFNTYKIQKYKYVKIAPTKYTIKIKKYRYV